MLVVRSKETKRFVTKVLCVGVNVKPPRKSTIAKFLGIDVTKATFRAALGKGGKRVFVLVKHPKA